MSDKEILGTTTISYKYQITVPKRVRAQYNFEKGDLIIFEKDGDRLYIKTSKDV